jgi:hypothetical protein
MMTLPKRRVAEIGSQNLSGGIIARVKRGNNWISITLKMKSVTGVVPGACHALSFRFKFKP